MCAHMHTHTHTHTHTQKKKTYTILEWVSNDEKVLPIFKSNFSNLSFKI